MTVGRLLSEISSRELSEWEAFYTLEQREETQASLAREAKMKLESRRRG